MGIAREAGTYGRRACCACSSCMLTVLDTVASRCVKREVERWMHTEACPIEFAYLGVPNASAHLPYSET